MRACSTLRGGEWGDVHGELSIMRIDAGEQRGELHGELRGELRGDLCSNVAGEGDVRGIHLCSILRSETAECGQASVSCTPYM